MYKKVHHNSDILILFFLLVMFSSVLYIGGHLVRGNMCWFCDWGTNFAFLVLICGGGLHRIRCWRGASLGCLVDVLPAKISLDMVLLLRQTFSRGQLSDS